MVVLLILCWFLFAHEIWVIVSLRYNDILVMMSKLMAILKYSIGSHPIHDNQCDVYGGTKNFIMKLVWLYVFSLKICGWT